MTRDRRRALEARIIADRKRRPHEPPPLVCATRGTRGDHTDADPPPVYTSREDGPGARPRVRK